MPSTPIPINPRSEIEGNQPRTEIPQFLVWFRRIGLLSLLGGGIGVIQASYFWTGVVCVYLGLFLLAIDVFFEPQLTRIFKCVAWAMLTLLMVLFNIFVVFVPAPLGIGATATPVEFPANTVIGGIQWKSYYTELIILINNPTHGAYSDLDLLLQPDKPVAAIGQVSNLSNVSFEDRASLDLRMSMDERLIPLVFVATNAGYKVHCQRMPAQSALRIALAVIELKPGMFNPAHSTAPGEPIPLDPTASSYVARTRANDGNGEFFSWWTHPGNEGFYEKRPMPNLVKVSGNYTASNRRRAVDAQISITY